MATSKNLDPTVITTSAEAFKYPLPQVRQFHRTLTSDLDEKNARLRTLVGGSYRQLLGTAETILEMRKDIEVVEERLSRVGEGCGRAVVGEKVKGLGKLSAEGNGKAKRDLEWLARVKTLGACGLVAGRLLRRGGDVDGRGKNLVLAAKVLVLSRLLAKSVGDLAASRSPADRKLVDESKRKLGKLKRRLRRAIERTLERGGNADNREDMAQSLAAYSLAMSSGAKDAIRHFLRVRGEAIALCFEDTENQKQDIPGVVKAIELYTRTLLDVQALVPRRLSEVLAGLKTKALLKDDAIRELEGLRLDVSERWFGDEIVYFMPYIRHDDLDGPLAVDTLKGWAKAASEVLLQGLAQVLEKTTDFKLVVEVRTKILEIWIKEGGKAKGFDPSILLSGLRKVINSRMVELLESRVSKLHLVGTEIEATLGSWRPGISDKQESLWGTDMLEMDINHGAGLFKQGILARHYGRSDAISRAFNGYQTWRRLVDKIITFIDQLKKQRWDDDLEDLEDDLSLESRNVLLSQEDPRMLQEHLDTSLERTYKELHRKIESLLNTYKDSKELGQISIYTLRIIRDLRTEIPKNGSLQPFGLSLVPSLHQNLAAEVTLPVLESFTKNINKKRVVGRSLWEGSPELPVQPSPGIFKFLYNLSTSMSDAGGDLWSSKAVCVLKEYLRAEVAQQWKLSNSSQEKCADESQDAPDGGSKLEVIEDKGEKEEAKNGTENREELLIQSLFDILVLKNAFDAPSIKSDETLETLVTDIESKLELVESAKKRFQQGAKEYWRKTSLLFGLLA